MSLVGGVNWSGRYCKKKLHAEIEFVFMGKEKKMHENDSSTPHPQIKWTARCCPFCKKSDYDSSLFRYDSLS